MNAAQTIVTTTRSLTNWDEMEEGPVGLFEIPDGVQSPNSDRFSEGTAGTHVLGEAGDDLVIVAAGLSDKAMTRRVLAATLVDADLRERLSALRGAADRPFREGAHETASVQALYDTLLTLTWETARGRIPVTALSCVV